MALSILVAGGAGYIGSHMVKMLCEAGHDVVTLDNLSTGHRDAVLGGAFVHADLLDKPGLAAAFARHRVDVVMHFASCCYVGESVEHPRLYYRNNVVAAINLLDVMLDTGVHKLVFSSSCATYGLPETETISESHPRCPVNPYGRTKLVVEQILADYAHAYGLRSVSLRYFNAAGSDPEAQLGERHEPETHLIPLALEEAVRVRLGGDPAATRLRIYGDDYATPDGTCIRDYVHVHDLCRAHLVAAERLASERCAGAEAYNLGTGRGFSVRSVIDACARVSEASIRYQVVARRPGDPPALVADARKAERVLGWKPQFVDLEPIIATAWRYRMGRQP